MFLLSKYYCCSKYDILMVLLMNAEFWIFVFCFSSSGFVSLYNIIVNLLN